MTIDTPDLRLTGQPVFDLDPTAPWPMPESKPVAPQTMRERVADWLERRLS